MTKSIKIVGSSQLDPNEFKGLYLIDLEVDGVPTGLVVGLKSTEIGIDVLSGSDILRFVDEDADVHNVIGDAIAEHRE
jgi:hypothetical protein